MRQTILEDKRQVIALYTAGDETEINLNSSGVTDIKPYSENGTTWFAVYMGEEISMRIPAYMARVYYM